MKLTELPFDIRNALSRQLSKLEEVLSKQNPYWHHKCVGEVVVSEHWALHLEDK